VDSALTAVLDTLNCRVYEWRSSSVGVEVHDVHTILVFPMTVHQGNSVSFVDPNFCWNGLHLSIWALHILLPEIVELDVSVHGLDCGWGEIIGDDISAERRFQTRA
jgi:hypothetical protein